MLCGDFASVQSLKNVVPREGLCKGAGNLVFDSHLPLTTIHPVPLVSDPTGLVWALNVMTLILGTFEFGNEKVLPA